MVVIKKTVIITTTSISIRKDLLKRFREIYDKEYFKGDSEAINYLIKKYLKEKDGR